MAILAFIFGLVIGSFLNVLISRLPEGKSILGFSKCLKCGVKIDWYDNIPILSFLILKGRCRNCRAKISWQYPLVELLTAFLFLPSFLIYGGDLFFLVFIMFLISLLIAVAFIDLNRFLIPDNLIFIGFLVSLVYLLVFSFTSASPDCQIISCSFKNSIFGLSFFAGILLSLFFITRGKGMGLGDVNLAGLLGFVFGLKNAITVFYLTFFIGFIVAIILVVFKKAGLKSKVPLGLVMAMAAILFLLSGFNLFSFLGLK